MLFYNKIVSDLGEIPNFISYYNNELSEAKKEVKIHGILEKSIAELPGIVEHRFNQLQEIEAVLEYLNIQIKKIRRKYFQQYLESYARALSSRDAEKYADGEEEILNYECIINEVALVRNQYLGIIKALEIKNWMLSNCVKLRVAGIDDVMV